MRKKKNRSKIDETMMFYGQRLCPICKKLIVASNPKSYEGATRDLGRKMKAHREEHQKKDAHTANLRHFDGVRRPL